MSSISLFLYAIRAEGTDLVKFGIAKDVQQRIRQLQTGSPHRLSCIVAISTPVARSAETLLHSQLTNIRQHGEWFKIDSDRQARDLVVSAVSGAAWPSAFDEPRPARGFIAKAREWYTKAHGMASADDLIDLLLRAGWTDDDFRRVFKAHAAEHAISRRR